MVAGRLLLLVVVLGASGCATHLDGPRLVSRDEVVCRDGSIAWHCDPVRRR